MSQMSSNTTITYYNNLMPDVLNKLLRGSSRTACLFFLTLQVCISKTSSLGQLFSMSYWERLNNNYTFRLSQAICVIILTSDWSPTLFCKLHIISINSALNLSLCCAGC